MEVKFRQATMDDLTAMAPLALALVASQKLPFKVGGTKAVEGFCKSFLQNKDGVCFIAEGDLDGTRTIVGWIGALISDYLFSDEELCCIRAWDVHPRLRNGKIGGQLLAKAVEWAKSKGVSLVSVGVNKSSSDTPELAFSKLEHAGFIELERFFVRRY